jgi:hypothetical protein
VKLIKLNPVNIERSEISSGSSLLNLENRIFVCCDDQYSLYELQGHEWVSHHWINSPELPVEPHARKKLKPDFEALLGPIAEGLAVLLIPSGSKNNRTVALKFNLADNSFLPFDMSDFFQELSHKITSINIEGAVVYGENYLFLNRGVQADASSIISVNAKTFAINSVTKINFGSIEEIALHGSELCIFENALYALAVAEDSANSYDDGKILGSSLFKISLDDLKIQDSWQFDKAIKTEGLCRWRNLWLVATDPDGQGSSEFFTFSL